MADDVIPELFAKDSTTIADIEAAGWSMYYSSGGGQWWVRNTEDGRRERAHIPRWVWELISEAERTARGRVQGAMLDAMGFDVSKLSKLMKKGR